MEVDDQGESEYIVSYYGSYAVEILITNFKDDSSIEYWFNDLFAASSRFVPEFELTTKSCVPILIKINQHDEATFEPTVKIQISVGMHLKLAAGWIYVISSTSKIGIWQEGFDTRNLR